MTANKLTRKQTETLERIRQNIATMPTRQAEHGIRFETGENSGTLCSLKRAGCIEGRIYASGIVYDLKVKE